MYRDPSNKSWGTLFWSRNEWTACIKPDLHQQLEQSTHLYHPPSTVWYTYHRWRPIKKISQEWWGIDLNKVLICNSPRRVWCVVRQCLINAAASTTSGSRCINPSIAGCCNGLPFSVKYNHNNWLYKLITFPCGSPFVAHVCFKRWVEEV